MKFEPKNINFKNMVQESFAKQGIMTTLGAKLAKVQPGECEIALSRHEGLSQQHGYLHAGVLATIADSAAGYAAFTLAPQDSSVLTTEFKINLLSPAKGDDFIARAKVIKAGKTLTIVGCEVVDCSAESEVLCAILTATIMTLQNRPEK